MSWIEIAATIAALSILGAAVRGRAWLAGETAIPRWAFLGLLLAVVFGCASTIQARSHSEDWFRIAMRYQAIARSHHLDATRWRVVAGQLAAGIIANQEQEAADADL